MRGDDRAVEHEDRRYDRAVATDAIRDGALALPEPARAELAAELLASLDGSPTLDEDELRRAWEAELLRRAARLDAGEDEGVPLDAALDQVRANLTG